VTRPPFKAIAPALYDSPDAGWQVSDEERAAIDALSDRNANVYGEILADSARELLAWLRLGDDDVFVDLGSGAARLVLQAAWETAVGESAGIEAAPSRHAVALSACDRLRSHPEGEEAAARVSLLLGDVALAPWPDATVLYLGSTCFSDDLMIRIAARAAALPRLRLVISTRPWPDAAASRFRERADWELPMSWANRVRLSITEPRRSSSTAEAEDA
jgi:histone methylation protein DOT1